MLLEKVKEMSFRNEVWSAGYGTLGFKKGSLEYRAVLIMMLDSNSNLNSIRI